MKLQQVKGAVALAAFALGLGASRSRPSLCQGPDSRGNVWGPKRAITRGEYFQHNVLLFQAYQVFATPRRLFTCGVFLIFISLFSISLSLFFFFLCFFPFFFLTAAIGMPLHLNLDQRETSFHAVCHRRENGETVVWPDSVQLF